MANRKRQFSDFAEHNPESSNDEADIRRLFAAASHAAASDSAARHAAAMIGIPDATQHQGDAITYRDGNGDDLNQPRHEVLGRLGSLACRWISDVCEGALTDGGKAPHFFLNCRSSTPSSSADGPRGHNLCVIDQHSSYRGRLPGDFVVAAWCRDCRHHVVFRIYASGGLCDGKHEYMHHLVCTDSKHGEDVERSQYYPLLHKSEFRCSATTCTVRIVVEVSEPRLPDKFRPVLLNGERTRTRLMDLMKLEPARFSGFLDNEERVKKMVPVTYLTQYIGDIVDPIEFEEIQDGDRIIRRPVPVPVPKVPRKISARNKIFQICFGDDFEELFRLLEFELKEDDGDRHYYMPRLLPHSDSMTSVDTRRGFFEALRIETSAMCDMASCRPISWLDLDFERPTRQRPLLERILYIGGRNPKTQALHVSGDDADFTKLGVNPDVHETLLMYACICQGQTSPESREDVFHALERVSKDRVVYSNELQRFIETEQINLVVAQSMQDIPNDSPYGYFDVSPAADDNTILEAYRVKSADLLKYDEEAKQSVITKCRNNLIKIARERNSDEIMIAALEMTVEDAVDYLGLGEDPEFICSVAETLINNEGKDRELVAQALRTIADNKGGNVMLHTKAQQILSGSSAQAMSESNAILAETLASQNEDVGDVNVPVGLVNIRNTCYLNSILQYFFTVKIVRDVVLHWGEYRLELTDENLNARRLAGSASSLHRGEAFLSRKFIEEIKELFEQLQSSPAKAVKPKQRLALASLKSADKLADAGSKQLSNTTAPETDHALLDKELPPPPPLPARPSPVPPSLPKRNDAHEPTVTVNPISEHAETASNVSSQTLVNQTEDEFEHTYVNVALKPDEDQPGGTSAMSDTVAKEESKQSSEKSSTLSEINSEDLADMQDGLRQAEPEKPDIEMVDLTEEVPIEEKIEKALNDSSTTGTDQEDVEEVMGNILEHLSAAIKSTGTDPTTGAQTDAITDVFYWTGVKMLRKVDPAGKTTEDFKRIYDLSRWMTAFPTKKEPGAPDIDLYEALDTSFDQEFQDDGIEQFSSIVHPPKILHVYIQRSQDARTKNLEHIDIPPVLYLDRYMDSPEGSELYSKRLRSWNLKRQLQSPASPKQESKVLENGEDISRDWVLMDVFEEADKLAYDNAQAVEMQDADGQSIINGRLSESLKSKSIGSDSPSQSADEDVEMRGVLSSSNDHQVDEEAALELVSQRKTNEARNREELKHLFSDLKEHPYRLHAVICHGSPKLGFGHYWVWIYDFEQNVWRQYNDTRVIVEENSEVVLEKLRNSSDPYYLSYVREEDIANLVNIPRRDVQDYSATIHQSQQDVEMQDFPRVEHVEEGDPPPYSA